MLNFQSVLSGIQQLQSLPCIVQSESGVRCSLIDGFIDGIVYLEFKICTLDQNIHKYIRRIVRIYSMLKSIFNKRNQ